MRLLPYLTEQHKNNISASLRRYYSSRKKIPNMVCAICSKKFHVSPSERIKRNKRFCSRRCYARHHIGPNNNSWKGGITKLSELIRKSDRYIEWRNKIFSRDMWTCRLCGKVGSDINADHYPVPFAILLASLEIKNIFEAREHDKLWDLDNGRTLCVKCHRSQFKFTRAVLNQYYKTWTK